MKQLPYGRHFIDEEDIQSVVKVLREGNLTQGPLINELEQRFATYCGSAYAVAVSSCTAGLHLSCIACNLSKNMNALTSSISFVSSANCVKFVGANIDFLDIDENTINLSIKELEKYLDSGGQIDLLIPVHFAGYPLDIKRLYELSQKYNFKIIEDAAHALGSEYNDGKKVGSSKYSSTTVFSLHPVKSITAGEGGIITTNDISIYKKLLRLRSHGINKNDDTFLNTKEAYTNDKQNLWYYEMQSLGYHYRITDIQCALAISQLKKLSKFIEKRSYLANYYRKELLKYPFIKPSQCIFDKKHSNHIFPVRIKFDELGINRNDLMLYLREKKITTQVHYIPLFLHPYYKKNSRYEESKYRNSMDYYNQALSLPLFYKMSNADVDYVLTSISSFFEDNNL